MSFNKYEICFKSIINALSQLDKLNIGSYEQRIEVIVTLLEKFNLIQSTEKLESQLSIQKEMIENLRKSNEFYADSKNWIQDTADCMGFTYRRRISNDDVSVEEVWMQEYMDNRYFGGKNAWEAKFKDQELQKKMEEVK